MALSGENRDDDILAYRPFVDGLRAVSIIAVVAYHAHVPGVTGGFVGVDVFFVISGFLIINQIVAGLRSGSFSFAGFWARRVLRILPPYLLVIAATLAIAPFLLVSPAEFAEIGKEAFRSALMIVNHHFYGQTGYFDTLTADRKPLLHLWSLAVEEQFYLVAPLMLAGLWWATRRWPSAKRAIWVAAIGVLFAASFAGCVMATSATDNAAFYLTPFRAWEFIAGGAIPLLVGFVRRRPPILAHLVGIAGAALILVAVFGLDPKAPYPSWRAALPVAGACLVILAGIARPATPVARALALGPMVWIGLISYAWYLWHWPLLAYVRVYNFSASNPVWDAAAVVLSFVLAVATRHLVELPVKDWRERAGRRALGWRTVGAGAGAAVAVGLVGMVYMDVVAPAVRNADPVLWADLADVDDVCALTDETRLDPGCVTAIGDRPIGLLVGNSHARMLYTTVLADAEKSGSALVSLVTPGCLPYYPDRQVQLRGIEPRCRNRIVKGLATIARDLPRKPDYAIISARWNVAQAGERASSLYGAQAFDAVGLSYPPPAGVRPWMALGLAPTIREVRALGVKRILLVGPVPELANPAPDCIVRVDARGGNRDLCAVGRAEVERRRGTSLATLRYLAAAFPDIRVIDPIDLFCDAELCRPFDDGGVLYVDDDHLSVHGAEKVLGAFAGDMAWVLGKAPSPATAPQPAE